MRASAATRLLSAIAAVTALLAAQVVSAADAGQGERARSALARVGIPEPTVPGRLALSADLGGGVTESLSDADSAHGRLRGSAAATLAAARWLDFGAYVSGRYDRHTSDARGVDDGFLFESELSARLAQRFGALGLGVEASAWLPGGHDLEASVSGFGADGRVMLSGNWPSAVLGGFVGYRLDRSARAAGNVELLRVGDRSALGASDFDALLLGIGGGYQVGKSLLFAETSAQLLLGSSDLSTSPIWLTLGARRPIGPRGLAAELVLDGSLSQRPSSSSDELVPIEPRVALRFGLRYRFGEPAPAARAPVRAPEQAPARIAPPVAKTVPSSVELSLLDERGQPLQRAKVVMTQGGRELLLSETAPGRYRVEGAEPGLARLRATAEGFQPIERDVTVKAGAPVAIDARAEPALPPGQLRGLVRSMRGKALAASVRVEPGGASTQTDKEGFFQLDVPPGDYEVVIEATGFQPQRRKAKVDQQGVVIVNVDLVQQ
jgi:hypothetical protein